MVRRSGKGDGWEQVERVESRVVTIQNWDNYQLELELELVSSIVQAILFQLSILYSVYSCPDYIYFLHRQPAVLASVRDRHRPLSTFSTLLHLDWTLLVIEDC